MSEYAVLTGDLVASRDHPSAIDTAMAALKAAAASIGDMFDLQLHFTRFRGDGWQVLLARPEYAYRAMVYLRARLIAADLGLDTRIAAGFGSVEPLTGPDLSSASGEAFFSSGRRLDQMGSERLAVENRAGADWQNAIVLLIDAIMSGWTPRQAEASAILLLEGGIHAEIAKRLDISRQAVQQRLSGARIEAVQTGIDTLENWT